MEEALAEYGRNAGLAFQLVDDLLDFTASPEQLGKPVLSDLKEGKVTLPLIFALEAESRSRTATEPRTATAHRTAWPATGREGAGRARISSACGRSRLRSSCRKPARSTRAANLARDYVSRAKACLEELPDTEYRRALLAVPDFILEREN